MIAKQKPIGERIRDLRDSRGISQRGLARAIGISQAAVSQIEAGQTDPSQSTLEKICAALEFRLDFVDSARNSPNS